SGEADTIRRQHATYFLSLADAAELQLAGADQGAWLDGLEAEIDNLRGALAWALGGGDAELGVRLVGELAELPLGEVSGFWISRGYWSEGRKWLEAALERSSDLSPSIRAMTLLHVETFMFSGFDFEGGEALHEEALTLFRAMDDTSGIALTLLRQ